MSQPVWLLIFAPKTGGSCICAATVSEKIAREWIEENAGCSATDAYYDGINYLIPSKEGPAEWYAESSCVLDESDMARAGSEDT